jgi:hypothetical protein
VISPLPKIHVILLVLCALSLAGCGVTKLWGDETVTTQTTVRQGLSLREQAVEISEPVWEVEEKGSFMTQVAGVLINGARSAGQALDVFDWSEDESAETRQAKKFLSQLEGGDNYHTLFNQVMGHIQNKNRTATAFRIAGIEALDYFHAEMTIIQNQTKSANRKERSKLLLNQADEDRRAAIQASKSLRQQAAIFSAAGEVLKSFDQNLEIEALTSEVGQLLLRADELRSLAGELDLD